MIGKKMRRLTGLLALLALLAYVIIPTTAFGDPVEAKSATPMGDTYYKTTLGITEGPSLTLAKYQSTEGDPNTVDENKPIQGVEFKYAKVGGLYQVETGSGTVMAYGITKAFGSAIGLNAADADYTVDDRDYLFFKDAAEIQEKTSKASASSLNATGGFLDTQSNNVKTGTTGAKGKVTCTLDESNSWGLYLVVETDVSNAKDSSGNRLSITKVQTPFLIALPTMVDNKWDATIEAEIKNATDEADVQKKIITNDDNTSDLNALTELDDTDTTSIGDTVWYRLKSTVPAVPTGGKSIVKYVLSDVISKGLTVNEESFTVVTWDGTTETELTGVTDYTLNPSAGLTDTEKAFEGGSSFTITFTKNGLVKLDNLAKSTTATARDVYVRYSATVNDQAVIGPQAPDAAANSGNPNKVKLTYQVDGSAEMDTEFDRVTHFTFGIDVEKELQGVEGSSTLYGSVTFKVYTVKENARTYYTFTGNNGVYTNPSEVTTGDTPTELKLDSNGNLQINGLEVGTYYLEEVATASGYRLLSEPVKFDLTSTLKGTNAFVGTDSQYLGTLDDGDTDGRLSATVVNTKGFEMPSTGESGIWICVVGGIAIVAAGCLYLSRALRRASE